MKVLLDENLPRRILRSLKHHDAKTVPEMGWKGVKNGELMKLIDAAKIDVFLTGDKNLSKQQNMRGRGFALVVMTALHWPIIRDHLTAIDNALPGTASVVPCGAFRPRHRSRLRGPAI